MDATIIAGSLDGKELLNSIDKLVKEVSEKTNKMADGFVEGIDKMKLAMKNFAITQKVSVDVMQEAWRKMSTSFDAMVAAQSTASGSGGTSTGGRSGKGSSPEENTVRWLEEQSRLQKEVVRDQKLGTTELQNEVDKHAVINKQLKNELKSTKQIQQETAKRTLKNVLSLPQNELKEAEYRLKVLLNTASAYKTRKAGILSEEQWHKLNNAIAKTRQQIDKLQEKKPKTIKEVLGMDESSLDAITAKMRALKRVQLDPKNTFEVKQLGDAYSELQRQQAKLMGKNIQLTHSNNYLAQSFGYIRNRIVYALTLGALSQFTKQVFAVRGEYEMLERSLGVLVNSFEKGSQIFQELNEMAIKSPFTLIELGTAAKQLTAYNFAAEEVVDTTRRLADISAALGVPMERLTYNLGQIKAQGVLNARDARDFANAGLAIVPMLAQLYTEQKRFGEEMVTTAQVYDMMSKKLVSYSDVLSVLYKITDEGGKFFDFQAKQAETLKVQMNNLTLAMNNMYNEIGASNQGLLVGTVQVTKKIFENWKTVLSIIQSLIVTYGAYKTILAIVNATHMRTWGARMIIGITQYINAIRSATGAMATFNAVMSSNAIVAFGSALIGLASYFLFFRQSVGNATVDVERFGESGTKAINNIETLGRIIKGVDENTSLYKKTVGQLNQILNDYGLNEIKNRDEINGKIEKTIELIKEESAARNRANMLARGQETFAKDVKSANEELSERLKSSLATTGVRKELNKNVDIITSVIGDIVQENISLIANKTGDEYEKGIKEIFDIIEERMRRIGISGKTIEQQLSYKTQFNQTNFANIRQYINAIAKANQTLDDYNNKTEVNYRAAKKATQSTMSMAEKINYNANAMKNASQDAVSLYNRVYEIVKLAQENHIINFDLKLTAENPPKWMMNMDLPKLQELAARFTAIAQSGGRVKGYTQETTYERGLLYASAARQKQYEEERKALEDRNKKDGRSGRKDEDIVAEALKQELQLIKEMQSNYDKLRKSGVSNMDAIDLASKGYEATIIRINQVLSKFGIDKFNAANFAGKDVRSLLQSLEEQRQTLLASGKVKTSSLQALDVEIQKLTVDAKTYDMKKVTDGLNSELGKLKDEYELAIELDANPELGGMFADMFGIDTSTFPRTINEYMQRVQQEFDNARLSLNLGAPLNVFRANTEQWYKWGEAVGYSKEQVDNFKKSFDSAVGVAKKWAQDTVRQTQDLQYKLADNNEKIAIEEEKLANLRIRLANEVNNEQKRLLELQIQDQQNAIAKLKEELLQLLPTYQRVFGEVAEHSAWMTRKLAKDYKTMLVEGQKRGLNPDNTYSVRDPITGQIARITKERMGKEIKNADKELQKTQSTVKKITEAFKKGEDGVVDWVHGVELIGEELGKMGQFVDVVGNIVDAFGNPDEYNATAEAIHDISTSLQGASTAAQGIGQFASGDYIGGATNILSGAFTAISAWMDNSDKKISDQIKESETAVKRLELSYIDLQKAADKAYGSGVVGAKKATAAAKELQLAELQRQLTLEQSRNSKDRDEDRILDLKKQIKELEYDIRDTITDITNDLLGGEVGSFAENLVSSMIDAFKQGEDYMLTFEEKFDEMVDNMIMKSIVSRVVAQYLDVLWANMDAKIQQRSQKEQEEYKKAQERVSHLEGTNPRDWAWTHGFDYEAFYYKVGDNAQKIQDAYNAELQAAKAAEQTAKDALAAAGIMQDSDITALMEELAAFKPELGERIKEILGMYYKFGQDNETELSALQQGIQGITEDTAGAIEAYMNIVAQRVSEQNLYLQEIRDHLNNFDLDVQLGTLSQMLLQLQQSYQVQQNIESILTGVLNPSGRAIVVELNS